MNTFLGWARAWCALAVLFSGVDSQERRSLSRSSLLPIVRTKCDGKVTSNRMFRFRPASLARRMIVDVDCNFRVAVML